MLSLAEHLFYFHRVSSSESLVEFKVSLSCSHLPLSRANTNAAALASDMQAKCNTAE